MRLERFIQAKKLLFIRTIIAMNYADLPKMTFCECALECALEVNC